MTSPVDESVRGVVRRFDAIAESLEKRIPVPGSSNTGNIIQFHGSAPGWMMAAAGVALVSSAAAVCSIVLFIATLGRISDLQARIDADSIKLEAYKISNEERARTDRLLYNKTVERINELSARQ